MWVSKEQRRNRCRRMGDLTCWCSSIEARRREGGAKLVVDLVLEVKTPFTGAGSRPVGGWYPYRYRPREPACLSQLTRCHRGWQHSRGPMLAAQTAGGNGCCFLYVFCLMERVVGSHTAGQEIVSFGQLAAEALGVGGVLEGWQVGWLGCLFGLDGGESQSVPEELRRAMRCW